MFGWSTEPQHQRIAKWAGWQIIDGLKHPICMQANDPNRSGNGQSPCIVK